MIDLEQKTVVITGAGAGIGRGLALKSASRGARVAVLDIREDAANETVAAVKAAGGSARAYQADVTDLAGLTAVAAQIEADFGSINVVFNNAGVISGGTIMATSPQDFDWIMDVNVRGLYNALKAFLPALERAAASGNLAHIVNLGSENSLALPVLGPFTAYTSSKHAILGLTEGLKRDLEGSGIAVSLVCPGVVHSELWNSKRTRPERFGGSYEAPPERAAVAAKMQGRSVEGTVETAFEGLDAGEYIIITDPRIRGFTVERLDRIAAALDVAEARVKNP